jgi:hypothetical protein
MSAVYVTLKTIEERSKNVAALDISIKLNWQQ